MTTPEVPAPGTIFHLRAIPPGPVIPGEPTSRGMAEATALLAARTHAVGPLGLADDVPAGEVIAALLVIAHAFMRAIYPGDGGARFLRELGADTFNPLQE